MNTSYVQKVVIGDATLYQGDCLDALNDVRADSIDSVICDLPYGTTACAWDAVVPLEPLWAEYWRVTAPDAPVVLFSAQPFTTVLISSSIHQFKYEWVYEKTNPKGFLNAKRRPLTAHENVCVFSAGQPPYFPQKWTMPEHSRTKRKSATSKTAGECYGGKEIVRWMDDGDRFPDSVIAFSNRVGRDENFHPTQKPLDLMKFLVNSYTLPGEMILDNTMGSGTTGVASVQLGRKFTGIERDAGYFAIACKRIEQAYAQGQLFEPERAKQVQEALV